MGEKTGGKKNISFLNNNKSAKQYYKVPAILEGETAYNMTQVKLFLKARDQLKSFLPQRQLLAINAERTIKVG